MNCSTLKKKLYDYMEDRVQFDMRDAMKKHIEECEECRRIYKEEKSLDDIFKNAFNSDDIKFTSSRATIMKNIDKNKYSGSLLNKILIHIKKYKIKYVSYAAILTVVLITAPLLSRITQNSDMSLRTANDENITMRSSIESISDIMAEKDNASINLTSSELQLKKEVQVAPERSEILSNTDGQKPAYIPRFNKISSKNEPERGMATLSKRSPNGKLEAQLDGRGTSAQDEGVADIFIINSNNDKWRLQLVDNNINFTPMYLEWMDNDNILVTMGYAQGHATHGGSVYLVNINSGEATLVYEVDTAKEQVAAINKLDNDIKLKVIIFTDDIQNNYIEEERIINFTINQTSGN